MEKYNTVLNLSDMKISNARETFSKYIEKLDLSDSIKVELEVLANAISLQYSAFGMANILAKENPDMDLNEMFLNICDSYEIELEKDCKDMVKKSRFIVIDCEKGE